MTPFPATVEPKEKILKESSPNYLKTGDENELSVNENCALDFGEGNPTSTNIDFFDEHEPADARILRAGEKASEKINYECAICAAKVSDKHEMVLHLRIKHEIPNNPEKTSKKSSKKDNGAYKCNVVKCNKAYSSESSLLKHKTLKHDISVEKVFKCLDCPSQFNSVYNLNAHRKRKHLKEVSESEGEITFETVSGQKIIVKKNKKKFLCTMCGKKFSHLSGLSYHKKNKHGSVVERPFKCLHCEAKYAMKRSLQLHMRKKHDFNSSSRPSRATKPNITCVLCSMTFPTSSRLCEHYAKFHKVTIESENLEFSSFNQFQDWKLNLERETSEKFILERGCQISKAKTKKFRYLCHRSGHFIRRGGGFRRLKNQGSKKMNAHCPAMMCVSEFENGVCKLYMIKTHVGHSADLCHIFLTPAERSVIANQIAAKLSFDEILDNIRQSVSGCPSERLRLLKRKDLHNIEKEFSLSGEAEKLQNDAVSIHTWVNNVTNQVDGWVLFYKPQGQASDVSDNFLKVDDFVLILMNNAQSEVLLKHCYDKIIIDGTFISRTDFHLITLLVIDDLQHSFPAAFLVSSRIDEEILFLFYYQIKLKVGTILTNVFMSDIEEHYYAAWVKVMGEPCNRLWSSWQVDSSWRRNIKRKINQDSQRAEIYKVLRVLCQEKNADIFTKTLNNFMEGVVQNVDLEEFRAYFAPFVIGAAQWASCYRTKFGIDNDTHIERMHRTLRHIFVKGRRLKELDKVMIALMKLVHDKLHHRDLILLKNNVSAKNCMIKNRHHKSLSLLVNTVIESPKGWQVPSMVDDYSELCFVSRNPKKQVCACKLFCGECQVCIHIYHCECVDSSILGNMCEHIHLVCRYLRQKEPLQTVNTLGPVERIVSVDQITSSEQIVSVDQMPSVKQIVSIDQMNPVDQMTPVEQLTPVNQLLPVEQMAPVDQMIAVETRMETNIDTLQNVQTVPNLMAVDSYEIYIMPEGPDLDVQSQMGISSVIPDLMQRKENVINLFLEAVNSVSNFEDMVLVERATADLVNSLATVNSFATEINQ